MQRMMQRSPKYAKRLNTLRGLQLGLYMVWPALLMWVLLSGPGKGSSGLGTARIQQTITETVSVGDRPRISASSTERRLDEALASEWAGTRERTGMEQRLARKNWESSSSSSKKSESSKDKQSEEEHIASSLKVHASYDSKGMPEKYYYRFQNVRLTRQKIQFFAPKDFIYPAQPNWVDVITGNATSADPPTVLVIKGEEKATKWFHMPVKYFPASDGPANCKGWVDKPAFFLQVRYSYNIWHTWNEGLMGVFQTLREQGVLPLVQIDADGNMREVGEGMGKSSCPLVYDPTTNSTRSDSHCPRRTGSIKDHKCDSKNQGWCRPGVWSYNRDDGPVIVPYTAGSVMNQWAQIYSAISEDVRDWSAIEGYCFRNLIVGKTSTLNYYQSINVTVAPAEQVEERVEAMSVFKAFVTTAQQEWVLQESAKKPWIARYKGYKDQNLERLRKGIGPENITLVDTIMPTEVPGLVVEEAETLARLWEKKLKKMQEEEKEAAMAKALDQLDQLAGSSINSSGDSSSSSDAPSSSSGSGSDIALNSSSPSRKASRRLRLLLQDAHRVDLQESSTAAEEEDPAADVSESMKDEADLPEEGDTTGEVDELVDEEEPEEPVESPEVDWEQAVRSMPVVAPKSPLPHEKPRPVVTYMCRNFFSRRVLNDHAILRHILSRYNVTVKITTFEEPLQEVMELMQHTDVLIGMHGAGWTNALFIKHGATAVQLYPYGWRLRNGRAIRGHNYREIVLANKCNYLQWFNPHPHYAFMRREDFPRKIRAAQFRLHFDHADPHPTNSCPGNKWIYQNTYVDMESFGPVIDEAMRLAKIPPMAEPQQHAQQAASLAAMQEQQQHPGVVAQQGAAVGAVQQQVGSAASSSQ